MKAIQLKTKTEPKEFAVLIEPFDWDDRITCDAELYQAVQAHGRAVIREFDGPLFDLKRNDITLSPQDFEEKWQGD